MTKILIVLLGLGLAFALAQEQASSEQTPTVKEGQFLLNLWHNKQTCEGKPSLAVSLMNDVNKCQVVLPNFFWAKAACKDDKLEGQICTDAKCESCFDIPQVGPQNQCKFENLLQGAYKYTCSATKKNVTTAKQAESSKQVNQTIGEHVKEKVKEKLGDQQTQTSEQRQQAKEKAKEKVKEKLGGQQTQTSEQRHQAKDQVKENIQKNLAKDKKVESQESKFVRVVTPKDEKKSETRHSKLAKGKL